MKISCMAMGKRLIHRPQKYKSFAKVLPGILKFFSGLDPLFTGKMGNTFASLNAIELLLYWVQLGLTISKMCGSMRCYQVL